MTCSKIAIARAPELAEVGRSVKNMKLVGISLISLALLPGFAVGNEDQSAAERGLRARLTTFLDKALDEFTNESGSATHSWEFGSKRWEQPFVTDRLLLLARMESYRVEAFLDGLAYVRSDSPTLKPPTPRCFWLPIPAEGTYSFKILSVSIRERTAEASVQFMMRADDKFYPQNPVRYRLVLVADNWRIGNVVASDGSDLLKFLQRRDTMNRGPEPDGAGYPAMRSEPE